jgi:hypothetical protein
MVDQSALHGQQFVSCGKQRVHAHQPDAIMLLGWQCFQDAHQGHSAHEKQSPPLLQLERRNITLTVSTRWWASTEPLCDTRLRSLQRHWTVMPRLPRPRFLLAALLPGSRQFGSVGFHLQANSSQWETQSITGAQHTSSRTASRHSVSFRISSCTILSLV